MDPAQSAIAGMRRFFVSAMMTCFLGSTVVFAQSQATSPSAASSQSQPAAQPTPMAEPTPLAQQAPPPQTTPSAQSTPSQAAPSAQGAPSQAAPSAPAKVLNDSFLRFDSLRLRIQFDLNIFDGKTDKQRSDQLGTFCKVWQDAFLKDRGPWGFGIASEVSCSIRNPNAIEKSKSPEIYDHWTLKVERISVDQRDVIQASLCRFRPSSRREGDLSESGSALKCEARKVFPWSEFRVRFVRHRAFVRLVAASLLDQLPFVSVVTKNLVRFDSLRIAGYPESSTVEVKYPPPPESLLFVEARYDPFENRFRLKELPLKEAVYRTMTQTGTVWIVSREGRAARSEEFTKNIETAFLELSTLFQLDKFKFEKDRANFVAEKLKSRPYMDFVIRGDGGVGIPALSLKTGYSAAAGVALRINTNYGAMLSSHYSNTKYELGAKVEELDNEGPSSSTSAVDLSEIDVWLTGRFFKNFRPAKNFSLELSGGPRIGFIANDGTFKTSGGLPQNNLSIRSREVGLGAFLGLGLPLTQAIELLNYTTFDMGMTARSSSLRAGSEFAWILTRLSTPGRKERPPGLRIGAGASFSSLGRRFVNNDTERTYETQTTLNGFQTAFFVEQAF